MNCYAGLAKRIVKSCFPQVVPVPQLEPLDASKIIKQEVKDLNTNKVCFALSDAEERVFKPKPLTDEEAWEATLAWAEAKAQEREATALKAASQTNTDESYDSDDSEVDVSIQPVLKKGISLFGDDDDSSGDEEASGSEDDEEFPLAAMAGLMRRGTMFEEKKAWNISDAAAAAAMWRDYAQADAEESVAVSKAMEKLAARATARVAAATIIQAAERGRAARARDAQIMDWLASDIRHIECARYLTRSNDNNGIDLISEFADKFAEQWAVSRKCLDFTSWAESVH